MLLARSQDPSLAQMPVPYLTAELIDDSRCDFYVEKLDKIYQKEM